MEELSASHPVPELQWQDQQAIPAIVQGQVSKPSLFLLLPKNKTLLQSLTINPVPSGFDYMRLILALCVGTAHSVGICYDLQTDIHIVWGYFRGPSRSILCMFFALSGFLVAGSIFRTSSISGFIALRVMRLLPALIVEVTLSAVILGGCLTALPAQIYFHTPEFRAYFGNIIGDIHFYLPGVFLTTPLAIVNSSLWTLPFEFICYVILIFILVSGLIRKRTFILYATFYMTLFMLARSLLETVVGPDFGPTDKGELVLCFLWGVILYLYADVVKLNGWLAAVCFAVSIALLYNIKTCFLATPLIAYATIYFGFLNPKRLPVLFSGDYSYGIYLYAFPIQQSFAYLFPETRVWWINSLLGLFFSGLFAIFSWHCIEKQVLRYKRLMAGNDSFLSRTERKLVPIFKSKFHSFMALAVGLAENPRALNIGRPYGKALPAQPNDDITERRHQS